MTATRWQFVLCRSLRLCVRQCKKLRGLQSKKSRDPRLASLIESQVVLGNGDVVAANNKTNPDLFTTSKGSQNNLAIITRLDIVAFEQPLLWGGTATYDNTTIPKQIEAFVQFTDNIEADPYGSLIFVWLYFPASRQILVDNIYDYTATFANNATEYPPAFRGFAPTSPIGPPVTNTLRVANLSSLTAELNSPANVR